MKEILIVGFMLLILVIIIGYVFEYKEEKNKSISRVK
jgi:hypothetical protein